MVGVVRRGRGGGGGISVAFRKFATCMVNAANVRSNSANSSFKGRWGLRDMRSR